MWRQMLAVGMGALLCASLAGCDSDDAEGGADTESSNTSAAEASNSNVTTASTSAGTSGSQNTTSGSSGGGPGGSGSARDVAERLGRDHFLIGMGNDLASDHNEDGAYTLGVTLDLHYAYLVGLPGQGGWPDWNADGSFVNILANTARDHGVVPMFTLYAMAAQGENQLQVLSDPAYMGAYWEGARLLFERLALFDDPAVVHLEPDFWAYTQQAESDPAQQEVLVGSVLPDCESEPETMVGMGHCLIALARELSPKVVVGFHASRWANPDVQEISRYLKAVGAAEADILVIETLDRDAGCFEVGDDPNCTRNDGPWYWDESNATSPNYHEHLDWAKDISDRVGKPLLWWQMPFGVPSGTPGGEPGKYRDNRVKYLFEHMDEFAAAGGVGAVFGVGAGNQTYITTDGGQFENAVNAYFADPFEL